MGNETKIVENFRYTKEHEWLSREESNDNIVKIGITDFAQNSLGDIVHIDLPSEGDSFEVGDEIAVVESAKSASEIYCPVSGTIIEVNDCLDSHPERVNESPYEEGWLVRLEMDDPDQLDDLLSADGYSHFLDEDN
ncbi:MAG: glycine cleavage system protein GcvH [Rickettsiales bacterium]|jgi:glycine cleavage system H protein